MIYNTPLLLKFFHWHNMFKFVVTGFLGFFDSKFSVEFFELIIIGWKF